MGIFKNKMGLSNLFTFTFRTLFVLSLLGLAAKQFIHIESNLPKMKTGLNNLEKNIPSHPHVSTVFAKLNTVHLELLHGHIILLVLAALGMFMNMRVSKFAMLMYVLIELAMCHNYILERSEGNLRTTLMFTSIMGSVFYC